MSDNVISFVKTLLIAGLLWAVMAFVKDFGESQFDRGQKAANATWLEKENQALTNAVERVSELEKQARETERLHQKAMAAAAANYQKDLSNVNTKKDRVIADLRDGTVRLRVELATASSTSLPGSESSATCGSAGRCDGATTGYLSVAASEFLVGLASEADAIVHQLTACQAIVASDRKVQEEQRE